MDFFVCIIHVFLLGTGKKHRNEKKTENLKNSKKRFMIDET